MIRAEALLAAARAGHHVIATAESCTGGLVAALLTDIEGCSHAFERGFVTYTDQSKHELLGVSPDTLRTHGAVSEEVAQEMVAGAFAASQATIAISVTGIAGPGGSEHKPEGRVCFGLAWEAGLRTETVEFGALGRDAVRAAAVQHAFAMILHSIEHDTHDSEANRSGNAYNLRNF